jgi:hypothetical protein
VRSTPCDGEDGRLGLPRDGPLPSNRDAFPLLPAACFAFVHGVSADSFSDESRWAGGATPGVRDACSGFRHYGSSGGSSRRGAGGDSERQL